VAWLVTAVFLNSTVQNRMASSRLHQLLHGVQEWFGEMLASGDKTITLLALLDREDSVPAPRNFPCIVPSIFVGVTCMAAVLIYVKTNYEFKKRRKAGPRKSNIAALTLGKILKRIICLSLEDYKPMRSSQHGFVKSKAYHMNSV